MPFFPKMESDELNFFLLKDEHLAFIETPKIVKSKTFYAKTLLPQKEMSHR